MVTDKQRANLAKGRQKGIKRNKSNRSPNGETWADLIRYYGEQPATAKVLSVLELPAGTSWKHAVVQRAYALAAFGNAPILRELMQRSEPQDIGVVVKKMTDDELRDFIAQQLGIAVNSD